MSQYKRKAIETMTNSTVCNENNARFKMSVETNVIFKKYVKNRYKTLIYFIIINLFFLFPHCNHKEKYPTLELDLKSIKTATKFNKKKQIELSKTVC